MPHLFKMLPSRLQRKTRETPAELFDEATVTSVEDHESLHSSQDHTVSLPLLLSLPREIRDQILSYALFTKKPVGLPAIYDRRVVNNNVQWQSHVFNFPGSGYGFVVDKEWISDRLISLLLAARQIQAETIDVFSLGVDMVVAAPSELLYYLRVLASANQLNIVKKVQITFLYGLQKYEKLALRNILPFLPKCKNLQLTLSIQPAHGTFTRLPAKKADFEALAPETGFDSQPDLCGPTMTVFAMRRLLHYSDELWTWDH